MSTHFRRDTAPRRAIRAALAEAGRPLAVSEVRRAAAAGTATVYRTLKAFIESGEARLVELPGSAPRYEIAHKGRHHHHFRCTACDRVYELEGCVPAVRTLVPKGFTLASHDILLTGCCADCSD